MKLVYMGTPDFAVAPLKALIEAGHELTLVLTREDRPKGRGYARRFTPVKEAALEAGIPVLQPTDMRDPALKEALQSSGAELFVVAAYGMILPKELLQLPRRGCVNIHASLLPDYRGAAPIQWAVIDGRKKSGVTTMQMDEGLDTGDILRRYEMELAEDETGGSLFEKLKKLGAEAIVDTLRGLERGEITPEKQGSPGTPYARMLSKEMGNLSWGEPAERLERLVRGLDPWPGAYSFLSGKLLKIWKTHEAAGSGEAEGGRPGTVVAAGEDGIHVSTGRGVLVLDEVQPEGKKRMRSADYLRGARVQAGAQFEKSREGG